MAVPQSLIDLVNRNAVELERLKAGESKKIHEFLREIDKGIRERLQGNNLTEFSRARLERLLVGVAGFLGESLQNYSDGLLDTLVQLANQQGEHEAGMITSVSADPVKLEFVIPTAAQLKSAVLSNPLSVRGPDGGKLIEPFIADWQKSEIDTLTGAIRQGYFEGQTTDQIIRRIRGTKASRYTDGLINRTGINAEAITRTAINHAATIARVETMKYNADICKGYRFHATLDSRTSTQCRALDGQFFEFGKGPLTPLHVRCRSTVIPELSDEFDWLKEGSTRSSDQGYTGGEQTYYDWLKTQTETYQDDVLGPTRGKLLRDGGLSAEKFAALQLDKNFMPITLEEMKKRNPLAFKRAGI